MFALVVGPGRDGCGGRVSRTGTVMGRPWAGEGVLEAGICAGGCRRSVDASGGSTLGSGAQAWGWTELGSSPREMPLHDLGPIPDPHWTFMSSIC